MSRDQNEEPLSEVIDRLLKAYGLEEGYHAAAISTHWERLMGPAIARRTGEIKLKQGVLTIQITSAVLREELAYSKEKVIRLINEEIGGNLVRKIELK